MKRNREVMLFALLAAAALAFQFRAAFADGHLLYPAVLEDPAARYSFLPWDVHAARLLHAGEFPLWNSLNACGTPLLANLQSSVFNPLKWPYYIFRAPRLLDLFVIARLALAAAFAFALARELGRSRAGAAAAGLALCLSGYLMKHQNMVNVSSEMWLPLLWLLALRERRGPSHARLIAGAAAFALVLSGGNPEAAFYVVILDLAFILVMARGRAEMARLALVAFAAPLMLGGLIVAAQLVPFAEYLGAGWHIHGPALHQLGRHPAGMIGSLVAPWLLGPGGTNPNQLISAPYLGAAVMLLALLGALHPAGAGRAGRFFAATALVLLGIVYALPGFDLLVRLPPLDRFGNGKFAMFGVTLAAAMLAGAGVDAIRSGRLLPRMSALALAGASIFFVAGLTFARRFGPIVPGGYIPPFLSLLAMGGLVFISLRRQRAAGATTVDAIPATRRAAVAAGIAALELVLLYYGFRRDTSFPAAMARGEVPAALAPVAADPGARFTAIGGILHPNLNLICGLSDLRSFDGLYPRRYVEAMGRIEGFGMDQAVENFFSHGWMFDVRAEKLGSPLLEELAVGYVVTREGVTATGLELVRSGDYKVYRMWSARPRVASFRWIPPGREIVEETSGRVTIAAVGNGILTLADTRFPGWRAEVDGRPVRIKPGDGTSRAVDLGPAGSHRVVFTYIPAGFRIGLWASLSSILAAAAFIILKISKP